MDDKDKFDLDINDERLSEQHDAAGSQPEGASAPRFRGLTSRIRAVMVRRRSPSSRA